MQPLHYVAGKLVINRVRQTLSKACLKSYFRLGLCYESTGHRAIHYTVIYFSCFWLRKDLERAVLSIVDC